MSKSIEYRPEIDGLRAIAVTFVIAFHAGFGDGGFLGVDIFFVISGYLIGAIVINESHSNTFSVRGFLDRRIRRIVPALFALCIVCLPPAWFLLPPSDLKDFAESITANALFNANHLFLSESGYFSHAAETKPLLHTWSLAVELQFYFLVALISLYAIKAGGNILAGIILLISFTSLLLNFFLPPQSADIAFYTLPFRLWEFGIGIATAAIISKNFKLNPAFSLLGFTFMLTPILFYSHIDLSNICLSLICVCGTGIFIASTNNSLPLGKLLSISPLVKIGAISYSLYLIHNPFFSFARYTGTHDNTIYIIFSCVVMMLYAHLSWRYVEQPFRSKNSVSGKSFYTLFFIFFLGSSVLLATVNRTNGFTFERLNAQQNQMMETAVQDKRETYCQTGGNNYRPPKNPCSLHGDTPTWAVFGDSHAGSIAYAIADKVHAHTGESTQWLSMRGAPPETLPAKEGIEAQPNQKWIDESLTYLTQSESIHTVIVIYRLNTYFYGSQVKNYPLDANNIDADKRSYYWEGYNHILQRLANSNKKIILITPIPEPRERVTDLIFQEGEIDSTITSVRKNHWDERNAFTKEKLKSIDSRIEVFETESTFCDLEKCFAVINNNSLYYDHNHLSKYGASMLAKDLFKWRKSNNKEIAD